MTATTTDTKSAPAKQPAPPLAGPVAGQIADPLHIPAPSPGLPGSRGAAPAGLPAERLDRMHMSPSESVLSTDLYQLTMMAAYRHRRAPAVADFECFIRRLPAGRGFLLAAGLEAAVGHLLDMRFRGEDVDWLRTLPQFAAVPADFFEYLRAFRFRGSVWAMAEGTAFFPDEPLLRVRADLPEAQLPETFVLASLNLPILVATKAARVVQAAAGRGVIEFGLRRAHGPEAGLAASRAAFIGGCVATSNVLAGRRFGIPVAGTMAHAWVQSHDDEADAFRRFGELFPAHTTALVDTYDTLRGTVRAAGLGDLLTGIRIDSGDLAPLSREARAELRKAGCGHTKIVVSNDLNETAIARLLADGADVDTFGVGTELVVSRDAPALGAVYKLVQTRETDGRVVPRVKIAPGKIGRPGAKQVWRIRDAAGNAVGDVLALDHEPAPAPPAGGRAEALLAPVIRDGGLVAPLPTLADIRDRAAAEVAALPAGVRRLENPDRYDIAPSRELADLQARLIAARNAEVAAQDRKEGVR